MRPESFYTNYYVTSNKELTYGDEPSVDRGKAQLIALWVDLRKCLHSRGVLEKPPHFDA